MRRLDDDDPRERVTLAELLEIMGERAAPALVLLFALPNVLPMPPGTSAVLGAPLLFMTVQLALGTRPWLPAAISRRSFVKADLVRTMRRVVSWTTFGKHTPAPTRRRLPAAAVRLTGAFCAVLALVVLLPIPFGNIPPALAICLCATGILRRDARWIFVGLIVGVASLAIVSGVLYALAAAIVKRVAWW